MPQATPTDDWSKADPLGTDQMNTVDDAIQRLERRLEERLNRAGHSFTHPTLAEAGLHCIAHGSGDDGVGSNDGEFTVYDEDRATKALRITNSNAGIAAAQRNRVVLDGTVLAGIQNTAGLYESDVADGASAVAVDFDNLTTLANAAALLMRVQNNGVSKFEMNKDGLIITAAVDSDTCATGTIGKRTVITGASSDIAFATTETVLMTTAYTPHSVDSLLFITVNVPYELSCNSANAAEMHVYIDVDSSREFTGRHYLFMSLGNNTARNWRRYGILVDAPGAGPFDIDYIHKAEFATSRQKYLGALWAPATMTILEIKR